ncbi:ABC transporter permease [Aliiruegeria lutimaris]|uniref:ABC-type nitrate/sulfonate/bicarbonate transport system, permease component n=1 Tax=Aliiruegeria lutimaris TaxID=571298 RepID=A0A1G9FHJ6_9RHOB|nr:ABC transporter permease subunit [Aliiruegeria lutimaris]SDK87885.1 ABC-type nitrate/sulfonate/bicarbonate transport system, permease component [Aliiruegeria lutimaris]
MIALADPLPERVRRGASGIVGTIVILLAWELAARALAGAYILAAPSDVVVHILQNSDLIWRALRETLGNATLGYVLGNLAAIGLAGAALAWPRAEPVVAGLALLVFCLPLVATGPILRVLYGPGPGPQITLAALAVYYTTFVPLLVGLRAAPASWFELLRSYGRGRLAELVHIRARASLPYLFAGLQIAAPAAFLGAMVGEFTGAERGLGLLAIRAIRALDIAGIWALASISAAVSILIYTAVGWLSRAVLRDPPPMILAPPALPRTGHAQGLAATVMRTAFVLAMALLLWWGAMTTFDLNPFFAKRPDDVWVALFTATDARETRETLAGALGETVVFLLPGFAGGLALGAGLAILLTLAPALTPSATLIAVALRSVPILTTAPLIVLLLGRGAAGTITLVAVMVFFPTFVACLHGLRQAPGQILDVFSTYAAGPFARLWHVQVPVMLPAFFAAARMSVPASVLAVTVVEWLATGRGIGSLMALSASLSDYDMLWSSVVIVSVLSALGYAGIGWVERRVLTVFASEQVAR